MQEILQQVISIARGMWKFRWPALALSWAVAIAGAVFVMRIPNQYEASARIFVDTDSILKPLMTGLAVQPNIDQQVAMLSRTMMSRPTLERLVRMADLDLKSSSKAEMEGLIDRLHREIKISSAGGVNIYTMSYRDFDPEKAKRVMQALVSIFVESGLGASRKDTDSAKNFLNEQIKAVEAQLAEAESRLKDFRLRNIDRQGADGRDSAARIGDLTTQIEAARLQLREAERAREAARRQLAETRTQSGGSTIPSLIAESSLSVQTPEIDARIEAQRRNLDGLLQRFTEQHPDVSSTRRLIAELEAQKRKEVQEAQRRLAAAGPTVSSMPTESLAQQELNRLIANAEVQVATMQARVDELSRRAAVAREQLKTAPQIEAEAAQLNRDYAVIRRSYDELVARRQSAVMSGELEVASGVTEFKLIDPPRVPSKPVSPNRILLMAGALVAAIAAGLGVAFAASQLRPTFGEASELRQATGLPLLGVVSGLQTDAERRRTRASAFRFVGASASLLVLGGFGLVLAAMMNR